MIVSKLLPAVSVFALLAVVGCSAPQSQLQLSSQKSGQLFQQSFPTGVADVQDAGDADIVVSCQTAGATADCPPVRQVMHVRVLWQQGYVVKSQNQQVAQNAAIHWYVTPVAGDRAAHTGDAMVEYHGTGLVQIERDGDQLVMKIVNAKVTPSNVNSPMMVDTLGTTKLQGTILARCDRQATAVALGDLRSSLASARNNSTAEAKLPLGQ